MQRFYLPSAISGRRRSAFRVHHSGYREVRGARHAVPQSTGKLDENDRSKPESLSGTTV